MKFRYVGLKGTLDLNNADILLLSGSDIFGFSYKAESFAKLNGTGELLKRIALPSKTITFTLLIKGDIETNLETIQNYFFEDINQKKPAKLFFNDAYIECHIVESSKKDPQKYTNGEIVSFTALALTPMWITEKNYEFSIHSKIAARKGFKLPMRFPTYFSSNEHVPIIANESSFETLAEISFYGPVINPHILVGNAPYGIEGTLLENERFIIDQRNKTVTKITESGDIINAFALRQKVPSVFNPIPKGTHIVGYTGTFSVKIVLFEGSVEPKWS